jgi:Flp pilus assembly protein TadD
VFWKIQKEFERAVEDYSSAISLVSNCDNYYSNRAMAYATIREFEKAVQDLVRRLS